MSEQHSQDLDDDTLEGDEAPPDALTIPASRVVDEPPEPDEGNADAERKEA